MFQVNDMVVYGYSEICEIKKIGIPEFVGGVDKYYYLRPVGGASTTTLYVKTTNIRKNMRSILREGKAEELLRHSGSGASIYNRDSRIRMKEYTDILYSCDCAKWMGMFLGLCGAKKNKDKAGHGLNINDKWFLDKVTDCLASELSLALRIPEEEARNKLEQLL
ncbi:CarD family transcriptional regulator [Lachnotalea sp. AF33-28]|uniref:CarD family transcriptional regulator n=1 Tax=Lachnotalea sp. AF33-28 TaxID=2292046 RepID=UPI000E4702F7|nr:CarD family transcriptional regulator [Lachnotalea sp. AF33-28]RHP34589.1 hypothetical protein DWZ56_08120 [Lachnotalea sp. AF33-28]